MSERRYLGKITLLLLLLYIGHLLRDHIVFERYLNSLSIESEDIRRDDVEALRDPTAARQITNYDQYSNPDKFKSNETIPRTIHFVLFGDRYNETQIGSNTPSRKSLAAEFCGESSDIANANFTINVWNATAARALLIEHYAWFLEAYDGYRYPAQRVNAFKYFVLYHYGGIYMDMDITSRTEMSVIPLLDFPAWFEKATLFGVSNEVMAARPNHPVIGDMTRLLKARDVNLLFPYLTVSWSSGPQFARDVLKTWFRKRRTDLVVGSRKNNTYPDDFFILPQKSSTGQNKFFQRVPREMSLGVDISVLKWLMNCPWFIFLVILSLTTPRLLVAVRKRVLRRKNGPRKCSYAELESQCPSKASDQLGSKAPSQSPAPQEPFR